MVISVTPTIEITELKQWLEKETANILQPLNEQGKKIVEKAKERLSDLREASEKLAEEGKREIERGKAVRKAKVTEKLSKYFLKQIDKTCFPKKMSFSELNKFHKDSEKALSSIALHRNVWFPRISPLFIIARKRVDFALGRLASFTSELGNFLSGNYSKADVLEKLFSETDELIRLLNDLHEHERYEESIKEKLHFLQSGIEESEKNIESVKRTAELVDLDEVNQRIRQLRKQTSYELRHLQKPFVKFANLTKDPSYTLSPEEAEKLNQYLEDPFSALATEKPGYPTLKSILKKVEKAMIEGKIKLKSSRLRKGIEKINAILNKNKLDGLQQSCAHLFSLNQQLVSSKEAQAARTKSEQLQSRLEELRKQKEAAASRLEALEREHGQLAEKANEQKKTLEKMVRETLEIHVSIKF